MTTNATRVRDDLRALVAFPQVRRLVTVRLFGQFGDGLLQAALGTFFLFSPERQATAWGVALAFAILLLPYSLIGPFAGVWLDRWDRRRVLITANLTRAALVGIIAWQATQGISDDDIALVLLVLLALGLNRLILAGHSAALPNTLGPAGERDELLLVTANALVPTAGTMAAGLGTVVGAGLRVVLGGDDLASALVGVMAAILMALAGLSALRITVRLLGPHGQIAGSSMHEVLRGLHDGARTLIRTRIAARAMGMVFVHRMLLGLALLTGLMLLRTVLYIEDADQALAMAAIVAGMLGLGTFLGAALTPWGAARLTPLRWQTVSLVLGGALTTLTWLVAFAVTATPAASVTSLALGSIAIGVAGSAAKVCGDALVQEHIHDDHRGRVFALYDMGLNLSTVIGLSVAATLMTNLL